MALAPTLNDTREVSRELPVVNQQRADMGLVRQTEVRVGKPIPSFLLTGRFHWYPTTLSPVPLSRLPEGSIRLKRGANAGFMSPSSNN